MIALTRKDNLEQSYWKKADGSYHRLKYALYLWALGCFRYPRSILEIGTGPYGGMLPLFPRVGRRVGVDPLYGRYAADGVLVGDPDIEYVTEHFEHWRSEEQFDAIFAVDALDHGEMGFHLMPKIAAKLETGGRFYLFVHLRPKERLNAIHDHQMLVRDLDASLVGLPLRELRREIYPQDLDLSFDCPCLVGVWERI